MRHITCRMGEKNDKIDRYSLEIDAASKELEDKKLDDCRARMQLLSEHYPPYPGIDYVLGQADLEEKLFLNVEMHFLLALEKLKQ